MANGRRDFSRHKLVENRISVITAQQKQAGGLPVSAGPPTRFRTASRLPLFRVGPVIGIIGRIGLPQICFADGFVFTFPNCVSHGLTDEFSALPFGGWRDLIQRSQERFVQLDQYRRHLSLTISWKHIDRLMDIRTLQGEWLFSVCPRRSIRATAVRTRDLDFASPRQCQKRKSARCRGSATRSAGPRRAGYLFFYARLGNSQPLSTRYATPSVGPTWLW